MGNTGSISSSTVDNNNKNTFSLKTLIPTKTTRNSVLNNSRAETTSKRPKYNSCNSHLINRYPLLVMKSSKLYKNSANNVTLLQSIPEIDSHPTIDSFESSNIMKTYEHNPKLQFNSNECCLNNYNSIDATDSSEFYRYPDSLTIKKLRNWFGEDLKFHVPYIDDCQFYDGDWYEISNNIYGLIPKQKSKSDWSVLPNTNSKKLDITNTSNAAKALLHLCRTKPSLLKQYSPNTISNTESTTSNTYLNQDPNTKTIRRRKTLCGCIKL